MLSYFHPFERLKRRRNHYLKTRVLPKVLSKLVTLPDLDVKQLSSDIDFIVLDIETTGLDFESDHILSLGWVEVSCNRVDLATCQHMYVNNQSQVKPETAVINHITPQMLIGGVSLHDAMLAFFEAAQDKVLVAHACIVEANFIDHYLKTYIDVSGLPLIWLDTMSMEKQMEKAISHHEEPDVTLSGTRVRYRLPEYNGHNALADAVATAELLLAQQKRLSPHHPPAFGSLYRISQ